MLEEKYLLINTYPPSDGLVDEKIHCSTPRNGGHGNVKNRLTQDFLAMTQFHDDVESGVQHQISDENCQHVGSEIWRAFHQSINRQTHVSQISYHLRY